MLVYLTFLFTFVSTGLYCFIDDMYITKQHIEYKKKQYKKIAPSVFINTFLILPAMSFVFEYYYLDNNLSYKNNLSDILKLLFVQFIGVDFFFYTCHYTLHTKYLYRWSHKKHHEFKYPVGIEALYLHWFDLIYGNILPLYLPMLFITNNKLVYIVWTFVVVFSTVFKAHGTHDDSHRYHHTFFKYNYGTNLFMDRMLGTRY